MNGWYKNKLRKIYIFKKPPKGILNVIVFLGGFLMNKIKDQMQKLSKKCS